MEPSECCGRTCWAAGWRGSGDESGSYECPATAEARGSSDTHDCGDRCAERSECCVPRCGLSAFGDESMCAAGATFRGERHECWSSEARSSGACAESDCCRQTCPGAGYTDGGAASCPEGMLYRAEDGFECRTGGCSDAECCGAPSNGTCWAAGFRDSSAAAVNGTVLCPEGQVARGQEDGHVCSGGACFASDCCYAQCWSSGWRDHGDASGSRQCPASRGAARGSMDDHWCSDGVCDEDECCYAQCWSSGWRDHGDDSGSRQCPASRGTARGSMDDHWCSDGVCDEDECCKPTCQDAFDYAQCAEMGMINHYMSSPGEACASSTCEPHECCRAMPTPDQWTCWYHGNNSEGWRSEGDTASGGTKFCPAGTQARWEWDHHCMGGWCGDFPESECCVRTCWEAGWRDPREVGSGEIGSGDVGSGEGG